MLFWVFVQILFRIRSDGFSLWFYVQIFGIKYVNQSQWVGYPVDPERQIPSYWPGWLWETKSAQFSNVCTQIVVASDTFSSAAAVFTKQVLKNTLWNTVEKNTMWTFVEFLVRISSRGKKSYTCLLEFHRWYLVDTVIFMRRNCNDYDWTYWTCKTFVAKEQTFPVACSFCSRYEGGTPRVAIGLEA